MCITQWCSCLLCCAAVPLLKSRAGKRFNEDGTLREETPTQKSIQDIEEAAKKAAGDSEPGSEELPHDHKPKWKTMVKDVSIHSYRYAATLTELT